MNVVDRMIFKIIIFHLDNIRIPDNLNPEVLPVQDLVEPLLVLPHHVLGHGTGDHCPHVISLISEMPS